MIDFIENPKKVTKEEVEIWEKENNIFLPDDYKNFLINIGTGYINFSIDEIPPVHINKLENMKKYPKSRHIVYGQKIPYPFDEEVSEFDVFWDLDELIEQNQMLGNHLPNKSSLLAIINFANIQEYCICIDRKSKNYGKIYIRRGGLDCMFLQMQFDKNQYKILHCLENTFQDFIENIQFIE
ncbi:MAG: SMI1/KNR4 family protein [Cyanobacteriota bacterium]